jgi:hypothetical protein
MGCSNDSRSLVQLIFDDASNAKVTKLYTTLLRNQNIGTWAASEGARHGNYGKSTLDISMDNTSLMNPLEGLSYLSQNWNDPLLHQSRGSRRFHLRAS